MTVAGPIQGSRPGPSSVDTSKGILSGQSRPFLLRSILRKGYTPVSNGRSVETFMSQACMKMLPGFIKFLKDEAGL